MTIECYVLGWMLVLGGIGALMSLGLRWLYDRWIRGK